MLRLTPLQSLSVCSRDHPIYLKFSTPYTGAPPSIPYRLKSISPYLSAIYTPPCISRISVELLHISIHMCLISRAAGICIPQWSHLGSGSGPSCIIATFDFQCRYMKCSMSLPGLFSLNKHPSTRKATKFSTLRKYTTYVSSHPPPKSTPLVYGRTISCVISTSQQCVCVCVCVCVYVFPAIILCSVSKLLCGGVPTSESDPSGT